MNLLNRQQVFLFQNYLLYAIAFLIPLWPRVVPLIILVFGLISIFAIVRGYSRVDMSETAVLMLTLFLLHTIGMTYTENVERGWFDLEVKLSLLAFPLAFVGFRFVHATNYRRILRSFLFGTLTASIYCFAQSAYHVFILDWPYYHFITSRFSVIVHQSYFTLYLIFSIIIHIYLSWPVVSKNFLKTLSNLGIILFLSASVILTGSKTGFIMWIIIAMALTVVFVREMKYKFIPIIGLAFIMSLIGILFQNAPVLQSRLVNVLKVAQSDAVSPKATESTAVRYLVYSSDLEVIKNQNWYGSGTGDFQDVLDAVYQKRGFDRAAEKHLNAHNLFLQTWISVGIPGLIIILGLFIIMFYQAIRARDPVLIGFATLFFIISMTESTFNVQAGVVFFSFFAVLLSRRSKIVSASESQEE